jgi:hypothetical protein
MLATFRHLLTSKEAQHGITGPPPRSTSAPSHPATVVPLEQLWTRLPQIQRQELLGQLTRILAQRLAPADRKEATDE